MSGFSTWMNEHIPVLGGLFSNDHEADKVLSLQKLAQAYQVHRPEMHQSQMNALGNQLSAYAPANAMLGQMYGPQSMVDVSQLQQDPFTPGMMAPDVGGVADVQGQINRARAPAPQGPTLTETQAAMLRNASRLRDPYTGAPKPTSTWAPGQLAKKVGG